MQQSGNDGGTARRVVARQIHQAFCASRFEAIGYRERGAAHGIHGRPVNVPRVIANDADDDHVLACALAGNADLIVSGDKHLHSLGGEYQGIRIVTPVEAVRIIETA